jgi:putative FmdB family regulatory protein
MPIYPYLCGSCGHHQDVLQKMSDSALTKCTQCGEETFSKQLSAPAFQLKGSGWYVTDFRENGKKPEVPKAPEGAKDDSGKPPEKAAEGGSEKSSEKGSEKASEKTADKAADKTPVKPAADATKATSTPAPTPTAASTSSPSKAPPATS